jgi:DNA-directed RNA polymerase beta' subunit
MRTLDKFKSSARLRNMYFYMRALGISPDVENDNLRLTVSPAKEVISDESFGLVKSPETWDEKSNRPIRDGLFCQKVFGPVIDYKCACGKYSGLKHKGLICDNCYVKVTDSSARWTRAGHINLSFEVVNPIFKDALASRLGIPMDEFERAMYQVEGCKTDLSEIANSLDENSIERKMFIDRVMIIPPNLRPVFPGNDGKLTMSGINGLYRWIITSNNRTQKLKDFSAPEAVIRNERRMLQETIDDLFLSDINGRHTKRIKERVIGLGSYLIDTLKEFWETSCDYSGRGIPILDSSVEENQVKLPEEVLLKLYDTTLVGMLKKAEHADTIKAARSLVRRINEAGNPVRGMIPEVLKNNPLIVTYKNTVSAFYPVVGKYDCIGLHPLACSRYGMQFVGDSVGFHFPLTMEARKDAKALVGRYLEGDNNLESAFSSLVTDKEKVFPLQPMIDFAINEYPIPLSSLDKAILSQEGLE